MFFIALRTEDVFRFPGGYNYLAQAGLYLNIRNRKSGGRGRIQPRPFGAPSIQFVHPKAPGQTSESTTGTPCQADLRSARKVAGAGGFEPPPDCFEGNRSVRLSHAPSLAPAPGLEPGSTGSRPVSLSTNPRGHSSMGAAGIEPALSGISGRGVSPAPRALIARARTLHKMWLATLPHFVDSPEPPSRWARGLQLSSPCACASARARTRTWNRVVRSHLLYPLSHAGIAHHDASGGSRTLVAAVTGPHVAVAPRRLPDGSHGARTHIAGFGDRLPAHWRGSRCP